jgi:hypothetical protein
VDQIYGTRSIFTAALLHTLHKDVIQYAGVRYDAFTDDTFLLFHDPNQLCPAFIAEIQAQHGNCSVPARTLLGALARFGRDLREANRARLNGGAR